MMTEATLSRLVLPALVEKRFKMARHMADKSRGSITAPNTPNKINYITPRSETQRNILFFDYSQEKFADLDPNKAEAIFMSQLREFPLPREAADKLQDKDEVQYKLFADNFLRSKEAIVEGWANKEKRRTGESIHLHPLRVFYRGLSQMSSVESADKSVYYTSLLARVLHDSKEDFEGFTIIQDKTYNKTDTIHTYQIKFNNSEGSYPLSLTTDEKRLLDLQLDALTIPHDFEDEKDRKVRAKGQVAHLLKCAKNISQEFGAYAAYQTLQIKIEDREDNLLTYYKPSNGNGKNTAEGLFSKCEETILFFRGVENVAQKYFDSYKKKTKNHKEKKNARIEEYESVVEFCYYLLLGGTYDEIVQYGKRTVIETGEGPITVPSLHA